MNTVQLKNVEIPQEQFQFLQQYKKMGFENENSLISYAIDHLIKKINKENDLVRSAELYAEIYRNDLETQLLVDSSINDWE